MTLRTKLPIAQAACADTATARADIADRLLLASMTAAPRHHLQRAICLEAAETIQSLRARVAELERDAGRYRYWIGEYVNERVVDGDGLPSAVFNAMCNNPDFEYEDAFDAAMQPLALMPQDGQQFADPAPGV